jgi:hypothetical protein
LDIKNFELDPTHLGPRNLKKSEKEMRIKLCKRYEILSHKQIIITQLFSFILITSIEFERDVSRYPPVLLNELPN